MNYKDTLNSSIKSALTILKLVIPIFLLADILYYYNLLSYVAFLVEPFTSILGLPVEASLSIISGMFLNLYAAVAFAAIVGYIRLSGPSSSAVLSAEPAGVDLSSLLSNYRGRVLLLLLGRDGCPGTAKATVVLDEYAPVKPDGAEIVRLDVPLPGESLRLSSDWKHNFQRFADKGRLIADELDFFFYPTLYIYDGDGLLRFAGGCDAELVPRMVGEILAEAPGQEKKIYTLPMPPVGTEAPGFSASTLEKNELSLESLIAQNGLLIFFARTSCPFTLKELPHLKDIADAFSDKGIATVIINQKDEGGSDDSLYGKHCAGVPVISDPKGEISKSFGVEATPFFFLLDGNAIIVKHRSFTHSAAVGSINALLGLGQEASRFDPAEAG